MLKSASYSRNANDSAWNWKPSGNKYSNYNL